jgi:hypothetical protein
MLALDWANVLMVVGLLMLRFGVPIIGIWLMSTVLKRVAPAPVWTGAEPDGAEESARRHPEQAAVWQSSPHAQAL